VRRKPPTAVRASPDVGCSKPRHPIGPFCALPSRQPRIRDLHLNNCGEAPDRPDTRSAPVDQFCREVMRFIEGMDAQDWLLALLAVVVVGVFCMRGFGSRSDY